MATPRLIINGQDFSHWISGAPGNPQGVSPYPHHSAMVHEATIPTHSDPGVAALIGTIYAQPDTLAWWLAGLRTDYFYCEMERQGNL